MALKSNKLIKAPIHHKNVASSNTKIQTQKNTEENQTSQNSFFTTPISIEFNHQHLNFPKHQNSPKTPKSVLSP